MLHFLRLLFLALLLPIVPAVRAQHVWSVNDYDEPFFNTSAVPGPNGETWVAGVHADGSEGSHVCVFSLKRFSVTGSVSSSVVASVEVPAPPIFSNFPVRLVSGGGKIWYIFRGTAGLRAIQVHPAVPDPLVETVSNLGAGQFSAAVAGDGLPYVLFHNGGSARLARRLPDGTWAGSGDMSLPEDSVFTGSAIALNDNRLDLFFGVRITMTSDDTVIHVSELRHHPHTRPEDVTDFTPGDYSLIEFGFVFDPSTFVVATNLRAAISADDIPAVIYRRQFGGGQTTIAIHEDAGWDSAPMPLPPGFSYDIPQHSIVAGSGGVFHVAWSAWWGSEGSGAVVYSRGSSIADFTSEAVTGLGGSAPSIALASNQSPRITSSSVGNWHLALPLDDTDYDANGLPHLLEEAFGPVGSGPFAELRPRLSIVETGGQRYPTITYLRKTGGVSTANPYSGGGFTYLVERSTDLVNWSAEWAHPCQLVHHQRPEHQRMADLRAHFPRAAAPVSACARGA